LQPSYYLGYNSLGLIYIVEVKKMADIEQMILEAIKNAGKPVRAADVVKSTGLEKDEVSKIMRKLKKEGKLTSPKACFYAPAED